MQKCQAMDGKEFSVEEAKSIPATEHPNCRRTFVAVIRGFNNANRQRAARDLKQVKRIVRMRRIMKNTQKNKDLMRLLIIVSSTRNRRVKNNEIT